VAHEDDDQFLREAPIGLISTKKRPSSSTLRPMPIPASSAARRRIDLYRRPGSRLPARNGSVPLLTRRVKSIWPAHGARQTAHAKGDQPVGTGPAGGRRDCRNLKKTPEDLDNLVDIGGDIEEGTPADLKKRADIRQMFLDIQTLTRSRCASGQAGECSARNKKAKRKLTMKFSRALVKFFGHPARARGNPTAGAT